jgi:flagellar basal body-associated protein FliL
LSSDTLGQPTSEVPPPVKKPPMRIVLVVILIIVIMLGAFVVYWFFLKPQIPWLFVGAYAEYSGETTVSDMQINATMRIEVVEYNATSAKILTYIRMENALLGRFYENQTTTTSSRVMKTTFIFKAWEQNIAKSLNIQVME